MDFLSGHTVFKSATAGLEHDIISLHEMYIIWIYIYIYIYITIYGEVLDVWCENNILYKIMLSTRNTVEQIYTMTYSSIAYKGIIKSAPVGVLL